MFPRSRLDPISQATWRTQMFGLIEQLKNEAMKKSVRHLPTASLPLPWEQGTVAVKVRLVRVFTRCSLFPMSGNN
jgi:hypothetical protein